MCDCHEHLIAASADIRAELEAPPEEPAVLFLETNYLIRHVREWLCHLRSGNPVAVLNAKAGTVEGVIVPPPPGWRSGPVPAVSRRNLVDPPRDPATGRFRPRLHARAAEGMLKGAAA